MSGVVLQYNSGSRLEVLNLVDESQTRLQSYLGVVDPNIGSPTYPFRYQGFSKQINVEASTTQTQHKYLELEDLTNTNNGITIKGIVKRGTEKVVSYTCHILYTNAQSGTDVFTEFSFLPFLSEDVDDIFHDLSTADVQVNQSTTPNTLEFYLPLKAQVQESRIYIVQGLLSIWEGTDRSAL